MATKRRFYINTYRITVLSEQPLADDMSLEDITYQITDGDCSGDFGAVVRNYEVSGQTIVKLLQLQNSDPSFFNLDAEGNDVEV